MKITIVLGAFFPVPPTRGGAVEKSWFALGKAFAQRGHEVTMISRLGGGRAESETLDGVRHLRVKGFETPRSLAILKLFDLIYSLRVRRVLAAADVLVTNTFWLPLLVRRRRYGRLFVSVGRYPRGQMRWYGHATRLQAPSEAIADAIREEIPSLATKVVAIPYPAPTVAEIPPPLSERGKIILYLGRVHPEKGVHLLVSAFAQLGARDWQLVITGPIRIEDGGGGEDYARRLTELAVGAEVSFRKPVFEQSALASELEAARLFVYPSLAGKGETFGLAPLEAMTHGCAVLVSSLFCFREFIVPEVTGFVFEQTTRDPIAALSQKLRESLADPGKMERIAEAGQKKASEFSLHRVAERFLTEFSACE